LSTESSSDTTERHYTVACLAGDGVGPEVMAEASLVLQEVGRLHQVRVTEAHVPFGSEALLRFGHPLPPSTRRAYRAADGILVANTKEPALEGVKADLDLTWRIQRVRLLPSGDIAIVSPLAEDPEEGERIVERAFALARSRRARVSSVGDGRAWAERVESAADRHGGVNVEQLTLAEALPLLAHSPQRFDVVVADRLFAEALSDMAAFSTGARRIVASGRLSESGPAIFGPTHGSALEIAGLGVADPSAMLLATALLLGEGLGERAAARTLERALRAAQARSHTHDVVEAGTAATTREFTEAVIAELPAARTDTEFFEEVYA
jgi:3-isopropylmalate dehydrogenase